MNTPFSKTPEQVQKSISAAFDSVTIITKTIAEPIDDKKKDLVKRNAEHCKLMLAKDWFEAGLTNKKPISTLLLQWVRLMLLSLYQIN